MPSLRETRKRSLRMRSRLRPDDISAEEAERIQAERDKLRQRMAELNGDGRHRAAVLVMSSSAVSQLSQGESYVRWCAALGVKGVAVGADKAPTAGKEWGKKPLEASDFVGSQLGSVGFHLGPHGAGSVLAGGV